MAPTNRSAVAFMAPTNWSDLPKELLNEISKRIDDEIDLICFRSVCSTWRSSSVPNLRHILPLKFPLFKLPLLSDSINNNTPFCCLSKQTLLLIKPPLHEQQTLNLCPWLIRISRNIHGQNLFYHPLFLNLNRPIFHNLVLDFSKLSVLHLGSDFFILDVEDETLFNCVISGNFDHLDLKKVYAVMCHGKKPLVIGAFSCDPQPLLLKCDDENWKVIPDMSMKYGDICLFKGQPYAVDKFGKTIKVGPDSSVQLVADPLVGGGDKKFLVESEGDLLLVDVYECLYVDFPFNFNDPLRFYLFKLNEKDKKWVKLTSVGDRVLFLGLGSSFSASASDLCVAKGNCIIFPLHLFLLPMSWECERYVFDLDQGWFLHWADYPEYFDLFLPPPKWILDRYQTRR